MILLKKWFVPVLAGFSAATAFVCMKAPAKWQEGSVFTNGIRLHYLRSGCSKPALVYSHDAGENAWSGIPFAGHFRRDFDAVLYDARGHGQSGDQDSVYSVEQHVEDLCGLIRRLPVDSPVCAGRGMGAHTACWLAALHPESVRALILIQPRGRSDPAAGATPAADRGVCEAVQKSSSPPFNNSRYRPRGTILPAEQESRPPALKTLQRESTGPGLREAFQRISCPVLILLTSESSAFPGFDEEMLRNETFPNVRIVFCRTTGDRAAVRVIRSFLRSSVSAPSQNPPAGP